MTEKKLLQMPLNTSNPGRHKKKIQNRNKVDLKRRNLLPLLLLLVSFQSSVFSTAHSEHIADSLDTGESVSGPLTRVFTFVGIGIFFLIVLSAIWLIRRERIETDNPVTYGEKINSFSMNARLYILHIQGMSLTFGVRSIIYNIYLLFIFREGVFLLGFEFNALEFIGVLLAIGSIITGIMAPFNGIVVDKLGKKWSFIMGDFIGACMIQFVTFLKLTRAETEN